MAKTDPQLLDAARNALHAILLDGAASYTISGRTFTSHNIKDLESLISRLEARVNFRMRRPAVVRFGPVPGGAG